MTLPTPDPQGGSEPKKLNPNWEKQYHEIRLERDYYALRCHALLRQIHSMLGVLDETPLTPAQVRRWQEEVNELDPNGSR